MNSVQFNTAAREAHVIVYACFFETTITPFILCCWQLFLSQAYLCVTSYIGCLRCMHLNVCMCLCVHSFTAHWRLRFCALSSNWSRCLVSTGKYYFGNFPTCYLVWLTLCWPQTSKQPSSKNSLKLLIILQTIKGTVHPKTKT